jgi:hypothetical protein
MSNNFNPAKHSIYKPEYIEKYKGDLELLKADNENRQTFSAEAGTDRHPGNAIQISVR